MHPAISSAYGARRGGSAELHGQSLIDPDQSQILTVFTASPGSESHDKLQFLFTLGDQLV
jgi:hypothetical protein